MKRRGSLGCLGCFSLVVMFGCTLVLLPILLFLDPGWFDRIAFWRGGIFEPDVVSVGSARSREAAKAEDLAAIARPPRPIETLSIAAVEAENDPAKGVTLSSPNGASLEVPPGAIAEHATVRMAPVMSMPESMVPPLAGPVYEIKVGSHEHYDFRRPPTLWLPVIPEYALPDTTLGVWENDHWQPLPSRREGDRIGASLPHASLLAVLTAPLSTGAIVTVGAVATAAVLALSTTATGRAARLCTWYAGSDELETDDGNFKVHYYKTGPNAVPPDAGYAAVTDGSNYAGHPKFVQDVARLLEKHREGMLARGFEVPRARLIRHDIFLLDMEALGVTPLGGPMMLTTRMPVVAARDLLDPGDTLRDTVVHEMFHIWQDEDFNLAEAYPYGWWLEASAAYLADWYWIQEGRPTNVLRGFYAARADRVTRKTMTGTAEPDHYAYGNFLRWMDDRYSGAGFRFTAEVNKKSDASFSGLDGVARTIVGKPLPDLFTEFAQDYYHNDLWSGDLLPKLHRKTAPRHQALAQGAIGSGPDGWEFTLVNRSAGGDSIPNHWAITGIGSMPPLTAHAFPFQIEASPPKRAGKLVVRIEPRGESPDAQFMIDASELGEGNLPRSGGGPGGFRTLSVSGPSTFVVKDIAAPGGIDRVTLLAINRSMEQAAPGFSVERWLLWAPEWVGPPTRDSSIPTVWNVSWERSKLKDFPMVFAAYKVYRRKVGEPDTAWQFVERVSDTEFLSHHAPDREDYVFTVSVEDKYGNEGEKAPLDSKDPFQGTWEGKIQLVEGRAAAPLMRMFRRWGEESDRKKAAEIAAARPEDRARMQQAFDKWKQEREELLRKLEEILNAMEVVLRAGLPLTFEVRRTNAEYFMRITKIGPFDLGTDQSSEAQMERVGEHTLAPKNQPQDTPPLLFRLHRENEIRGNFRDTGKVGDETQTFELKWVFKRLP